MGLTGNTMRRRLNSRNDYLKQNSKSNLPLGLVDLDNNQMDVDQA
jgi:hypothetical protein